MGKYPGLRAVDFRFLRANQNFSPVRMQFKSWNLKTINCGFGNVVQFFLLFYANVIFLSHGRAKFMAHARYLVLGVNVFFMQWKHVPHIRCVNIAQLWEFTRSFSFAVAVNNILNCFSDYLLFLRKCLFQDKILLHFGYFAKLLRSNGNFTIFWPFYKKILIHITELHFHHFVHFFYSNLKFYILVIFQNCCIQIKNLLYFRHFA